jgi:hypothetical protein
MAVVVGLRPDCYERPALTVELQALVQGTTPDPWHRRYIKNDTGGQDSVVSCLVRPATLPAWDAESALMSIVRGYADPPWGP